MNERIDRLREKIRAKGCELSPVLTEAEVVAFEREHGITLPEAYRAFVTHIGGACSGPPDYGLIRLGGLPRDNPMPNAEYWRVVPKIQTPFPFTKPWIWEGGEETDEGTESDLACGSICLGTDGCGMFWHLIVTGPDRGIPWMISGEGIQPVAPKRDFLQWFEDWLDGKDHGRLSFLSD